MNLPPETKLFILAMGGFGLMVPMIVVNNQIIRHVCGREGRKYSILWLYDSYWLWRTFKPSWFAEAKDAGYLVPYAILLVAWIAYVVVAAVYFLPLKPT